MDAQIAESLLSFAESAGPGVRGPDAKAMFEQLDQKYADLQLAMDWFVDQERADDAFRLANSLVQSWMATKRLDDGRRLGEIGPLLYNTRCFLRFVPR